MSILEGREISAQRQYGAVRGINESIRQLAVGTDWHITDNGTDLAIQKVVQEFYSL